MQRRAFLIANHSLIVAIVYCCIRQKPSNKTEVLVRQFDENRETIVFKLNLRNGLESGLTNATHDRALKHQKPDCSSKNGEGHGAKRGRRRQCNILPLLEIL